MHYFLESN